MLKLSRLDELALNLPAQERKVLLGKIVSRLSKDQKKGEIVAVEMSGEERDTLIAEDVGKTSWVIRVMIWLRSVFTGKDPVQIFLSQKLQRTEKGIRRTSPNLVDFASEKLTSHFARRIYDLYCKVFPLIRFYRTYAENAEFRNESFTSLLSAHYAGGKNELESFLSSDEIEQAVAEHKTIRDLESVLAKRLGEHLRNTPKEVFSTIEQELKPFVYLERIVLYSYGLLLRHFAFEIGDTLQNKYPPFDSARASDLIGLLEQLMYCAHLARKIPRHYTLQEELVSAYTQLSRSGDGKQRRREQTGDTLSEMRQAASELVEEVRKFDQSMPLLDVVRFFRRDPYHFLVFNLPGVSIKEGYASSLREQLSAQLKDRVLSIRSRRIDQRISELFAGEQLTNLYYYNYDPDFDVRRLGLSYFAHIKSMTLLHNYVLIFYKKHIREAIRLASSYALASNRIAQNRMLQYETGLEGVEAKIVFFDRSLSPEEEGGATLSRYRNSVDDSSSFRKYYRTFIRDKDKEALSLIERGKSYLIDIRRTFDETTENPMENTKAILKSLHTFDEKTRTLGSILRSQVRHIEEFLDILNQLLAIEKEN